MTKLEDQISSARTLRHVTIVMFVLAELFAVIHAYKLFRLSSSPFSFVAFGMVLAFSVPYMVSRNGLRLLGRLTKEIPDPATQAALSQQISTGANLAYAVLFFMFGMLDLTIGWRG